MDQKNQREMMNGSTGCGCGLKVLLMDDDRVARANLEQMLLQCGYIVTLGSAMDFIPWMEEKNFETFDLVICDAHVQCENIFVLLVIFTICLELPVVVTSVDDDNTIPDFVRQSIIDDATCEFLKKPITLEDVKVLHQHITRKKLNDQIKLQNGSPSSTNRMKYTVETRENPKKFIERARSIVRRGGVVKKRMVWTQELHGSFVKALNYIGETDATPSKILKCMKSMGVTCVTRQQISRMLQKYYKGKSQCEMKNGSKHTFESNASVTSSVSLSSSGSSIQSSIQG